MKKLSEETVEKINKILLVIMVVFVFLSVYIWISTVSPRKKAGAAKDHQAESAFNLEQVNQMGSELEEESVRQTYSAVKGFKVAAKNREDSNQQNEDAADTSEFAFPDSYIERLTDADVRSLTTKEEVQDAINYIYARSGCIFRDEEKKGYYEQFDWYEGSYYVDEMNDNPLNYMTELQHDNIELLAKRRNELNE